MATVRPRASRSSAPAGDDVEAGLAKAIAAVRPASPAPATRTSQTRSAGSARRVMGDLSAFAASGAPQARRGETAPPDFDKAEAARSSRRAGAERFCRRREAGGTACRVEKRPVRAARAAGFSVHRVHRLRRRGRGARPLRRDRAHFADLLRLARARAVHRRDRRDARARSQGARDGGVDRRRRPRPRGRLSHLRARAGRGAVALGPHADRGLVLDRPRRRRSPRRSISPTPG